MTLLSPNVELKAGDDAACQVSTASLFPIYFHENSAELLTDSLTILGLSFDAIRAASQPCFIHIDGYSDRLESTSAPSMITPPLALGLRRAGFVRDWLVNQGLSPERVVIHDGGILGTDLDLIDQCERNRRVDFRFNAMAATAPRVDPELGRSILEGVAPTPPMAARRPQVATADGEAGATAPGQVQTVAPRVLETSYVISRSGSTPASDPYRVETVRIVLKIVSRTSPGANSRDLWPVAEFLRTRLPELEDSYRQALRYDNEIVGPTRMRLLLDELGQVKSAQVSLPSKNEDFCRELTDRLRQWTFPPPPGGGFMQLELVISVDAVFSPTYEYLPGTRTEIESVNRLP